VLPRNGHLPLQLFVEYQPHDAESAFAELSLATVPANSVLINRRVGEQRFGGGDLALLGIQSEFGEFAAQGATNLSEPRGEFVDTRNGIAVPTRPKLADCQLEYDVSFGRQFGQTGQILLNDERLVGFPATLLVVEQYGQLLPIRRPAVLLEVGERIGRGFARCP
jgi:hypothetical protein